MRDLKITYGKRTVEYLTHGKHLEMEIIIIIKQDWYNYSLLQLRELRPKEIKLGQSEDQNPSRSSTHQREEFSTLLQNLKCEK